MEGGVVGEVVGVVGIARRWSRKRDRGGGGGGGSVKQIL